MRNGLVVGVNVDPVNVEAGLLELAKCGYQGHVTTMVIEHALNRWGRGEEEAAQRGATDSSFHGITLTCWYRVLAAARAGAQPLKDIARGTTVDQNDTVNNQIARQIADTMVPTQVNGEWYLRTRDMLFALRLNQDTGNPVWASLGFYTFG